MAHKVSFELSKSVVIFGAFLFVFGYFVGNVLPIVGGGSAGSPIGADIFVQPDGQDAAAAQGQQQEPQKVSLSIGDDPTLGSKDAKVIVYEFSDFQCPFCQRFYSDSIKQMEKEYVDTGKVLFVYKDFPLQQIHPAAVPASIYANCANEQGKFKVFHDAVFDNQYLLGGGQDGLDQIAQKAGLDMAKLQTCASDEKHITEIQADLQEGAAVGVTGTPSIFIGNAEKGFTQIVGAQPYSVVKQTIDQYLQ